MTPIRIMLLIGAFFVVVAAIVPQTVWVIGAVSKRIMGKGRLRYAPFGWASLAFAAVMALSLTYGFYIGRWRLTVKEVEYRNEQIPSDFDGFRIALISDMHLSTFFDRPEKLDEFIAKINGQNVDVICFTGDFVSIGSEETVPYTESLLKMHSRLGVISVLGNHDMMIYGGKYAGEEERLLAVDSLAMYERGVLGWKLLRNESLALYGADSSKITFIGVDNKNCSDNGFRHIDCGDLPKAMLNTDGFRILLSHDPSHWVAEVVPDTDIPLTLSGHTHAAQIRVLGLTPAAFFFETSYGKYEREGQTIYVNPGLGCTAPFRIGARPEITVITLRCK